MFESKSLRNCQLKGFGEHLLKLMVDVLICCDFFYKAYSIHFVC